ncbi:MAG TPA: hypothetical protein VGQ83_25765 [Polyangia bacterium]|jgi:hypothetical protein
MRKKKPPRPAVQELNPRQTLYHDTFLFTDDQSGPPDDEFYRRHAASTATIRVGAEERVRDQVLRCFRDGQTLVVQLYAADGSPASPRLVYRKPSPAELQEDAAVLEARFDTQFEYTINSTWHDGERNVAVYTVAGLRANGAAVSHEVFK